MRTSRLLIHCCCVIVCGCPVATIGLAYLRADLALNECRREQVRVEYQSDMKARSAAWTARKQAAEKVATATEAAQHPRHSQRSALETVVPIATMPTSPSAIGAALHDGTYSREQGHAGAPNKADK